MAQKKGEKSSQYLSGLHRSETNKVIAGVAGGLGEYFAIDPTIVRILFVLLFFFSGTGLLIYIVLWIVMPKEDSILNDPKDHIKENMNEFKSSARKFAHDIRLNSGGEKSKVWVGLVVIILGFLLLLNTLGFYNQIYFAHFWPVLLVIIGLLMLTRNGR
jgi:phage shock protein C